MNHENHLFIIWEKARIHEKRILADINSKFEILYKINVKWSKQYFSSNLTRFYGTNLPPNSHKEKHIGMGKFLVVVVKDLDPSYAHHETTAGNRYVNNRIYLSKTEYRDITGGGHKIHGTNTQQEFLHDFALLFGCSLSEFSERHPHGSDLTIDYKKDLVGFEGWQDLQQVFKILNLTQKYTVMRNFEPLPNKYYAREHGDIDFLVDDYDAAKYILNATSVFDDSYRVHNKIRVNKDDVLIDLRFVGDNYYDIAWQEDILRNRIEYNGFYIMDDVNHFYSLLYHAVIHKPAIADDYIMKLGLIDSRKHITDKKINQKWFTNEDALRQLACYLSEKRYSIVKPEPSVYFNVENVQKVENYMREAYAKDVFKLDNISSIDVFRQRDERRFYKARRGDESYFIKSSHTDYQTEYDFLKLMYKKNPNYFVEPIAHKEVGEVKYLMTRWCEGGVDLDSFVKESKGGLSKELRRTLLDDMCTIADILWSANVSHRDIIPRNFMVIDGRLKLIDFYWAVLNDKYQEYDYVLQKPHQTVTRLGEDYAMGMFEWDDSYSFLKIAEFITNNQIKYSKLEQIKSRVGKRIIRMDPVVFYDALRRQDQLICDMRTEQNKLVADKDGEISDLSDELKSLSRIKQTIDYRLGALLLYPLRRVKHYIYHKLLKAS